MKDIKILYENADFAAVFKPAGISTHPDGKNEEYTMSDFAREKFKVEDDVGEPMELSDGTQISRPGIVHRLDKPTSGVLLLAKTKEGYDALKKQFKSRSIKKTYFAFTNGVPKDERGSIDFPIARALGSVRKWTAGKDARGELREAHTRYKVLGSKDGVALLILWPLTGRTHQIRVHLKAIGHPIISDVLYAPVKKPVFGLKRLALHAGRLIFKDMKGKETVVLAPFPEDFKGAISKVGLKADDLLNS